VVLVEAFMFWVAPFGYAQNTKAKSKPLSGGSRSGEELFLDNHSEGDTNCHRSRRRHKSDNLVHHYFFLGYKSEVQVTKTNDFSKQKEFTCLAKRIL
jgi:hypothetical protein